MSTPARRRLMRDFKRYDINMPFRRSVRPSVRSALPTYKRHCKRRAAPGALWFDSTTNRSGPRDHTTFPRETQSCLLLANVMFLLDTKLSPETSVLDNLLLPPFPRAFDPINKHRVLFARRSKRWVPRARDLLLEQSSARIFARWHHSRTRIVIHARQFLHARLDKIIFF